MFRENMYLIVWNVEAKSKKYSIKITLNHPDLQDKFQDHLPLYPDLDNTRGKVNIVIFSGKFRANILQLDPKISDSFKARPHI